MTAEAIPSLRVAEGVAVEAGAIEIVQAVEIVCGKLIVRELRVRHRRAAPKAAPAPTAAALPTTRPFVMPPSACMPAFCPTGPWPVPPNVRRVIVGLEKVRALKLRPP
jgi:hypothetical protein